jgi:hypothetical protein
MFVVNDMGLGLGTTPVVIVMFVVKDMTWYLLLFMLKILKSRRQNGSSFHFEIFEIQTPKRLIISF